MGQINLTSGRFSKRFGPLFLVGLALAQGLPALAAKKVLILTEDGGGGHIAAAKAVEDVLKKGGYQTHTFKPLVELRGDKLFNKYMKDGSWSRMFLLTLMQQPLELVAPVTKIRSHLKAEIDQFGPDLIVSVYPIANKMTYSIARKRSIPMLVLPTDLEAGHFFHGIRNPGPDFKIGLAFDDEAIKGPLRSQFSEENFEVTGFPLRAEFGLSTSEMEPVFATIRKELGIHSGDRAAIIMMGAQGAGNAVQDYATSLLEHAAPLPSGKLHIIALCGKNEELLNRVTELAKADTREAVKVHALGFKDARYMAALMRMADVLISKPGGSTVNEAIASEIRTLFHRPEVLFSWEAGNMRYAQGLGLGEKIKNEKGKDGFIQQFNQMILRDRVQIQDCPGRTFGSGFLHTVEKMMDGGQTKAKSFKAVAL